MFHGTPQCGERALVADVAQPEEAIETEQKVGVALSTRPSTLMNTGVSSTVVANHGVEPRVAGAPALWRRRRGLPERVGDLPARRTVRRDTEDRHMPAPTAQPNVDANTSVTGSSVPDSTRKVTMNARMPQATNRPFRPTYTPTTMAAAAHDVEVAREAGTDDPRVDLAGSDEFQ